MNIEFHTPINKVSEHLLNKIRNELLAISQLNNNISRAEVIMKVDENFIDSANKTCEIRLTIYSDDLVTHNRMETFEKSAREAIRELKRMVKQQAKKRMLPPDVTISTVKV